MTIPEALAFDMYGTLVDPSRVCKQLARYVPEEQALHVSEAWRQKQLEFTFRLIAMERYEDFEWVTRKALDHALASAWRELDADQKDTLMAQYNDLELFADVEPGLQRLKEAGFGMIVFSNGAPSMLEALMNREKLHPYFQVFVSVDEVKTYKPSPRVYRHGLDGRSERCGLSPRIPSTSSEPRQPGCGLYGWIVPVDCATHSARVRRRPLRH